jgi:hypothetical protein
VVTSIEANARPSAVTVNVLSASPVYYGPTLTLWVLAPTNVTEATISSTVGTALTTYFAGTTTNPIGGVTMADDLNPGGITGVSGSGVVGAAATAIAALGCTLSAAQGAVDLALTPAQVAVDSITLSIRLISTSTFGS